MKIHLVLQLFYWAAFISASKLVPATKKAPLKFESKEGTKFEKLRVVLVNHILSFLTVDDFKKSFPLIDTTCYTFCQEIKTTNLRFFTGKFMDIPEISGFSVSEPEIQRISVFKQIAHPVVLFLCLYFEIKDGNQFQKLKLPILKYLARISDITRDLYRDDEMICRDLASMALEYGHVDSNFALKVPFELLSSRERSESLRIICTNPQIFHLIKGKSADYESHELLKIMAHMIINQIPLIEFFFNDSRNEEEATVAMREFANNLSIINLKYLISTISNMDDIPKSEFPRIHGYLSDLMEKYLVDTSNDYGACKLANDIRFGAFEKDISEIPAISNSWSFYELAYFAFLNDNVFLFQSLINSSKFQESKSSIESVLDSHDIEDGVFKFLANVSNHSKHRDIKNLIRGSAEFIKKTADFYHCTRITILPEQNRIYKFSMTIDAAYKDSGFPGEIYLAYKRSSSNNFFLEKLRFKDPMLYSNFSRDFIYDQLSFSFYRMSQENFKLLLENDFLADSFRNSGVTIELNSSILEAALNHPQFQNLRSILNPEVRLNAICALKTDLQFKTLETLLNTDIGTIVKNSLSFRTDHQTITYFKLKHVIAYCLKKKDPYQSLDKFMHYTFWDIFKIHYPEEYANIHK